MFLFIFEKFMHVYNVFCSYHLQSTSTFLRTTCYNLLLLHVLSFCIFLSLISAAHMCLGPSTEAWQFTKGHIPEENWLSLPQSVISFSYFLTYECGVWGSFATHRHSFLFILYFQTISFS